MAACLPGSPPLPPYPTPLCSAAQAAGADLDRADLSGATPLKVAASRGSLAAIRVLLGEGEGAVAGGSRRDTQQIRERLAARRGSYRERGGGGGISPAAEEPQQAPGEWARRRGGVQSATEAPQAGPRRPLPRRAASSHEPRASGGAAAQRSSSPQAAGEAAAPCSARRVASSHEPRAGGRRDVHASSRRPRAAEPPPFYVAQRDHSPGSADSQ